MKINIRLLYLYLFSFVGLLIAVIGSINMINVGLKTFVFKDADRYEFYDYPMEKSDPEVVVPTAEEQEARQSRELKRQRQRELSNAIAMLAVGTPLYMYHWKTIQKEDNKKS